MFSLGGKVAIVTGAGSGIGEASARAFGRAGARVAVCVRRIETGMRVAADIRAEGGEAVAIAGDIGEEHDIADMVSATLQAFGRIDILYNNAGLTSAEILHQDRDVATIDADIWDRILRVNLRGTALFSKHVIPHMIEAGGGSVIISGSARGSQGDMAYTAYAASKAGLVSLSQNIAAQYGKHGIRSNILVIGMILTDAARAGYPPQVLSIMERHHLTPFIGGVEDVAAAALFLAADESRFVTGQQFFVDGGISSHSAAFADGRETFAAS